MKTNSNPTPISRRRPLIDKAALSEFLDVTPRHVDRLVFERRIPFIKVGGRVRFNQDEIDRWIEGNTTQVAW